MRTVAIFSVVLALSSFPVRAHAAVVWTGDFEQNNLTEWSYQLNAPHIRVVSSPVARGTHAANIQLTNDAVWPNGLKRVELQHAPSAGRTDEGKTLFFAWSFYLPEKLPATPSAQIGYWESKTSYQQMMSFAVKGEDITFATRKPVNKVAWDGKGVATAGRWHRIAMSVLWSTNATKGRVDVWFDGTKVVDGATAQTRADANELFTQLGLLRDAVEFADAPVIVVDDAAEGDSLADVRPDDFPRPSSADAGILPEDGEAGSDAATGSPPNPAVPASPASPSPSPSKFADGPDASSDDSGCNVSSRSGWSMGAGSGAWLVCALAWILRRRRRLASLRAHQESRIHRY